MAHDFASRQRKKSQPEPGEHRVRGAVPKTAETPEDKTASGLWSRLPGWGWLSVGLVAGFVLAQMFSSSPSQEPVAAQETPDSQPEAEVLVEESAEDGSQPRFDFYTLLPESEVIAPKIEAYQSTPRDAVDQPSFMLQVGSFRTPTDAVRQQERLQELGFEEVRIHPVETGEGDIWHRVQIGPFQDRRTLARAQDDIAAAGLEFMLLRLKKEDTSEEPQERLATPVEVRDELTE
ncbi:SPOR domain-containing protein [Marinospirillum sp.]|uniref:SPOR domain-containing protein n=1 Tax=Marinospirillum sp. TaxID=2183934 RepID=UPI0028707D50|nr:SPOR domain-containing protein [Marinospirillum sp.]MDR9468378.1 SPOR domain-containing protein [Marinospirillum sp.]